MRCSVIVLPDDSGKPILALADLEDRIEDCGQLLGLDVTGTTTRATKGSA